MYKSLTRSELRRINCSASGNLGFRPFIDGNAKELLPLGLPGRLDGHFEFLLRQGPALAQ
jgi:hypothetical protein